MTETGAELPAGPLGRLAGSIVRRRWANFLIEFVLIIVGILAALAIDGWVNDRDDLRAERIYLELLVRDLEQIELELAEQLDFEQVSGRNLAALYGRISAGDTAGGVSEIGEVLSQLAARRTLFIDSAAYTDLLSTGSLGLIRDRGLRDGIVRYFTAAKRSELVIEKNNSYLVDEAFGPFIRAFGVSFTIDEGTADSAPSALQRGTTNEYFSEFMPDPPNAVLALPPEAPQWDELRRQLTWRATNITASTKRVRDLQAATSELRERVEASLSQ